MMEEEWKHSQKELNLTFQELEEQFKGFPRESDEKSAGMAETWEKRFESEMEDLFIFLT